MAYLLTKKMISFQLCLKFQLRQSNSNSWKETSVSFTGTSKMRKLRNSFLKIKSHRMRQPWRPMKTPFLRVSITSPNTLLGAIQDPILKMRCRIDPRREVRYTQPTSLLRRGTQKSKSLQQLGPLSPRTPFLTCSSTQLTMLSNNLATSQISDLPKRAGWDLWIKCCKPCKTLNCKGIQAITLAKLREEG